MTRTRLVNTIVVAVVGIVFAVGCGGDGSDESASSGNGATSSGSEGKPSAGSRTIGILAGNLSSEIIVREVNNAKATAAALGWKTVVANPNNDPAKVGSSMLNFVNQGVDAIFFIAADATAAGQGLSAAKAKKIPVFSLLVAPEPNTRDHFTANIADPSEQMGELAAASVVERFPDTPVVQDQLTCNYAGSGFATPFNKKAKELGADIAGIYNMSCTNLVADATTAARTLLRKVPGKVVYVTLLDFAPPLLENVFKQLRRTDVTVYTRYDISPTLDLIRQGKPFIALATDLSVGLFDVYDRLLKTWVDGDKLDTSDNLDVHGFKLVDESNVPKRGEVYPFEPAIARQLATWRERYTLPAS